MLVTERVICFECNVCLQHQTAHIFIPPTAYNFPKGLVVQKTHSLHFENNVLEINGVVQVVEVDEKEGQFKLENSTLVVKGSGLNIAKLDKDQGLVVLEVKTITSIGYKQGVSLKGLFR